MISNDHRDRYHHDHDDHDVIDDHQDNHDGLFIFSDLCMANLFSIIISQALHVSAVQPWSYALPTRTDQYNSLEDEEFKLSDDDIKWLLAHTQ